MSKTLLFHTIQFRISTQFKCRKQFYFKIQFSISTVFFVYTWLNVKKYISRNSV